MGVLYRKWVFGDILQLLQKWEEIRAENEEERVKDICVFFSEIENLHMKLMVEKQDLMRHE